MALVSNGGSGRRTRDTVQFHEYKSFVVLFGEPATSFVVARLAAMQVSVADSSVDFAWPVDGSRAPALRYGGQRDARMPLARRAVRSPHEFA
jgi:hypothetical protein